MMLVEKGTHPKWTGGFVTMCRCGHRVHEGECGDWGISDRGKITVCRCPGMPSGDPTHHDCKEMPTA